MIGLKKPMPDGRSFARNGETVRSDQINAEWLLQSGAVILDASVEEITDTGRPGRQPRKPEPPKVFSYIVAEIAEVRRIPVETVIRCDLSERQADFDLDEALAAAMPIPFASLSEDDQEAVREIAAGTTGLEFDDAEIEKIGSDADLFKARMTELGSRKTKPSADALKDEYRAYLTRIAG